MLINWARISVFWGKESNHVTGICVHIQTITAIISISPVRKRRLSAFLQVVSTKRKAAVTGTQAIWLQKPCSELLCRTIFLRKKILLLTFFSHMPSIYSWKFLSICIFPICRACKNIRAKLTTTETLLILLGIYVTNFMWLIYNLNIYVTTT